MGYETAADRFARLMWPLRDKVLRTALMLCERNAEAEDLAQETLMKAFKALNQFDESTGSAHSWLMAILRNARVDRLRSTARSKHEISIELSKLDLPAAVEKTADHSHIWDDPEKLLDTFSNQEVIKALQALPEEIRWTLLLVDVEQLDYETAAEIMGIPIGTAKSRAHRGRAMLKEFFQAASSQNALAGRSRASSRLSLEGQS